MYNRIAVCGSHSCGKTTLIKELNRHLGYPMIKEIAATYDPSTRLNMQTQHDIMKKQIRTEIEYIKLYGKFLSDRSVLDNLAYCNLVFSKYNKNKNIYTKCNVTGTFHINTIPRPYDLLIFVDEILPYKQSDHRNFDTYADQKYIFDHIKNNLNSINTPDPISMNYFDPIQIIHVSGSTHQRVDFILNFINYSKKEKLLN